MKILVIGAGPAGLSAAALLAGANREVTVIERRARNESHGWGVTLRNNALSFLDLGDLVQPQALQGRRFIVRGECRVDYPNPPEGFLVTLPRDALVGALAKRCEERGVQLRYGVEAAAFPHQQLKRYDLVVGADGANSALRQRYAQSFAPSVTQGGNYYVWAATRHLFRKLTILLSDRLAPLVGWGYQYDHGLSSFIVECTASTYLHHGGGGLNAPRTQALLQGCFSAMLEGAEVLCVSNTRWSRFPNLRCAKLSVDNIVLVGDAAHTTHFSQGFGTLFAFDDALALSTALNGSSSIADALALYQRTQQPKIEQFQSAAGTSQKWSEQLLVAFEAGNEAQMNALVAARWPTNSAPPAPLAAANVH